MKHIRGRHLIVGILESTTGGLIVATITQHIWWLLVIVAIVAGSALALELFNLQDEEEAISQHDQ